MKIQNINPVFKSVKPNYLQQKRFNSVNFGLNPFRTRSKDRFESQNIQKIKTVKIKDLQGKPIKAIITKEPYNDTTGFLGTDPKKFTLRVDGAQLGYAITYNSKYDDIFVKELFCEENKFRHYKGAGTELLKCIVEESYKQGYNGKVHLKASHVPVPFAFYYKNNFKGYGPLAHYNAAIEYSIRSGTPISSLVPDSSTCLTMKLDEKEAKAFKRGKRLHQSRFFKTVLEKDIKNKKYVANLIESPNEGEFYFQVVNEGANKLKQELILILTRSKDSTATVYEAKSPEFCYERDSKDFTDFVETALRLAQEELKAEEVIIKY